MTRPRFIEIDGRRYLWRGILEQRRAQIRAWAETRQPALFDARHDCRPATARTAAGRYLEPSLFDQQSSRDSPSNAPVLNSIRRQPKEERR